jgi:endonuclease YncB( thermonuclease family)
MKKLYVSWIITIISALLLSGCAGSEDMVNDFEKTRNYFNGRLGTETSEKGDSKDKKSSEGIKSHPYYTWQIQPIKGEFKAKDDTRLIEATVLNIVDGDTIDVKITNSSKESERIRMILVNTPESKGKYEKKPQPYSIKAYEFTRKMLTDRKIWIEKGVEERDKFGRLLAYVWLDQVVLNEEMETEDGETVILGTKLGKLTLNELLLREGLAHVAIYPPNTKYVDEFEAIQKKAKKEKKGIWSK